MGLSRDNGTNNPEFDRRHYKSSLELPEKMGGVSYQIPSPAGMVYVIFMEDNKTNKPVGISIHIGKAGAEISAWAYTVSALITRGLVNRTLSLADVRSELSGITTDKSIRDNESGMDIRSSVEAIVTAIARYQTHRTAKLLAESKRTDSRLGRRDD